MTNKISKAILYASMLVFLATMVIILGSLYTYFTGVQHSQLKIETKLAAQGVTLSGEKYLHDFDDEKYRITWIGPSGVVLYDNKTSSTGMENHLEREEIKEALRDGYGESTRYSSTLSERLLYSAMLLPDGSVIRLSHMQTTLWSLILGFAQPICIVGMIVIILSYILASRLSKMITAPINRINPDKPEEYIDKEDYKEINPLLIRMRQQQLKIKSDKEELEKTSLIRQEFTANVSHELKTPLHTISGYAELLEQGMVREEDVSPFAGKIRQESQRVSKLVEDIIELTRLDGGGKDLIREAVDLYQIAQNAVDSLIPIAENREISLSISGEKAEMTGISHVLYSIVYNLCDNAIKYNRKGGTVKVTVQNHSSYVWLIVSDDGIGIPPEFQSRIFERFYRVDRSRSKEVGGTGLGLSIVKHGLIIHHAEVRIESTPGKGTSFYVRLPKDN